MKLLFDENLPPSLVRRLADLYPDSAHIHQLGLGSTEDEAVWSHAKAHGFTITTKDSDFQERSALRGAPPKVIWIQASNCSVEELAHLLRRHSVTIHTFGEDPTDALLVLT